MRSEQPNLDELLRDGASALGDPSRAKVRPGRAHEAEWVDGAVLEEPAILGRENRVDEGSGRFGQSQRTVVLAGPVGATRQHFAFERGDGDRLALAGDAG